MPELSAAATLDLWQAVDGRDPVARALALASASGGGPPDELARLPLGRRDALLLELHTRLFGRTLEATAPCPACGEQAEFSLDCDELLARAAGAPAPAPVEADGLRLEWRPPDSRDVAAAAAAGDAAAAERVLLERCVVSADGAALPAAARAALERAIAEADPLAELLVDVGCPACGEAFVADLDVGDFVWSQLRARARRLLGEVDALARAYGWSEEQVLALVDRRRAAYLELAGERAP